MKNVLIIRPSAIGDVVFATPFAAALRRTYPDARISWLVEPGIDALIAHDPCIDERVLWPKNEWKRLWREGKRMDVLRRLAAFRGQLRSKRYDTVIDLQGLMKSGFLAWLTGAPRRIGLGSREGSQRLMTEVVPRDGNAAGNAARISSEYLHLAERLGLDCGEFLPRLAVSDETRSAALARLASHGLSERQYAVFAPFTTRPQKHWFADAWQSLAPLVRQQTGMIPVLLGGPADRDNARTIAAQAPDIIDLTGQTNLAESAALIGHAGALIGVDTGLTHMGIAFSIPTVAIFGSTCPYTDTGRRNARVVWLGLPCSPCRRRPICNGAWTCLRDITPERVMQELALAMKAAA